MTKVNAQVVSFPGGLIVDHDAVGEFDNIPSQWLEAAKNLTLHYGHTSHGSQINSGIFMKKYELFTGDIIMSQNMKIDCKKLIDKSFGF